MDIQRLGAAADLLKTTQPSTTETEGWRAHWAEKHGFSNEQLNHFMKTLTSSVMSFMNKTFAKSRERMRKLRQEENAG